MQSASRKQPQKTQQCRTQPTVANAKTADRSDAGGVGSERSGAAKNLITPAAQVACPVCAEAIKNQLQLNKNLSLTKQQTKTTKTREGGGSGNARTPPRPPSTTKKLLHKKGNEL